VEEGTSVNHGDAKYQFNQISSKAQPGNRKKSSKIIKKKSQSTANLPISLDPGVRQYETIVVIPSLFTCKPVVWCQVVYENIERRCHVK